MLKVAVYFDFISPYAHFGWTALRRARVPLRPIPVVFSALLDAHGQLGPAEIPSKRSFTIRDCLRRAAELDLPFTFPPRHPYRSIDALRLCLPGVAGERQPQLIDALFAAAWQEGRDLSDPEVLRAVLGELDFDADELLTRAAAPESKKALRAATDAAIERGVFGVPTFEVSGELIWGSDRVNDALALAGGAGGLDPVRVAELESRMPALQRRNVAVDRPTTPAVEKRINAIFDRAAFMKQLGVELVRVRDGAVETRLETRDDHRQQDGFVHAAVVAALADHSAGAAAGTVMPDGKTPLTVEYKINMLRPAAGPELRCRARVVKPGRTITVAEAEVESVDGGERKQVATATVTLAVVDTPAS